MPSIFSLRSQTHSYFGKPRGSWSQVLIICGLFSAMRSDHVVSSYTQFCTFTGKMSGSEPLKQAEKIEYCNNKHFKHFSSLYCLWRLLLTHASAAFLLCCYLVKSALEKSIFCLELLMQQSMAMSTKQRFCKTNHKELAFAISSV